jgi:hypothetical protein
MKEIAWLHRCGLLVRVKNDDIEVSYFDYDRQPWYTLRPDTPVSRYCRSLKNSFKSICSRWSHNLNRLRIHFAHRLSTSDIADIDMIIGEEAYTYSAMRSIQTKRSSHITFETSEELCSYQTAISGPTGDYLACGTLITSALDRTAETDHDQEDDILDWWKSWGDPVQPQSHVSVSPTQLVSRGFVAKPQRHSQ